LDASQPSGEQTKPDHLKTANAAIGSSVSVVIPAFNEEAGIAVTLDALTSAMPTAEIIVVDDGSSDQTAKAAAAFPSVTVLSHEYNRGYGAALKTGMRAATREIVAWFDADNEHRVEDLLAIVRKILDENLAAVIGQRNKAGPSAFRDSGKWLIRQTMRTFNVNPGPDVNCGLRAFRREVIVRYLPLMSNAYSASVTSTMIFLERGYPLAFQPVELNPRIGVSKVRIRDGFRTLGLVMRVVMLFAPLRIFLPGGLGFLLLGGFYGVGVALMQGQGVPIGSVVLILTGLLMLMFGLIADQISQMRLSAFDETRVVAVQDARKPRPQDDA